MNRQTQRQIIEDLKLIFNEIKPEFNKNQILKFKNLKHLCQKELSKTRSAHYEEMFDGLILALKQFPDAKDDEERQQMLKLSKDLIKLLLVEVVNEKEVKKDIVFLPYKASMWDSLETIWRAAYEDKEHCNTYVVPIPYADRNPDQTVAKWHCEANLFPNYVPVLDWKKFDLKKMHPDVIFIHNPYDNCNAVTSVGMEYYSSALKECTDCLVYVPYFVLSDNVKPGDETAEEKIAHYITTLGVLNSDLVFVQSEDFRQIYINVLIRHTNQKDRKYWEKRIIGIGSPKYDKLILTKKADLKIPKDWLKILKKPDGNFKKIIFLNVGLTAVLMNEDKYMDKLEDMLQTFKKNKDEIALLWRPHPLIPATLVAMLPTIKQRYENIVNQYKSEGWGIFDESSDLNRAIILSDAYYGDTSSIVAIYKMTGKPIMYNRVDFLLNK